MPTLANIHGASTVSQHNPQLMGMLQNVNQLQNSQFNRQLLGQQYADQQAQAQQQAIEKQKGLASIYSMMADELGQEGADEWLDAYNYDPDFAQNLFESVGMRNEQQQQEAVQFAKLALELPPEQRMAMIAKRKQQLELMGRDSTHTANMLNETPEQQELSLRLLALGGDMKKGTALKSYEPMIDPNTGQPMQVVFDPNAGTSTMQPVEGAPIMLTPQDKANLEVETATKKEEAKLLAQRRSKINTEINTNAQQARQRLPKLRKLLKSLDSFETGKLAQAKALAGPYIPGVDPSSEQIFISQVNKEVMSELNNFPGSISEKELDFAAKSTFNIGNTTEANRAIINHAIQSLNLAIKEQELFKAHKAKGGKPEDFDSSTMSDLTAVRQEAKIITQQDIENMSTEELMELAR